MVQQKYTIAFLHSWLLTIEGFGMSENGADQKYGLQVASSTIKASAVGSHGFIGSTIWVKWAIQVRIKILDFIQ